MVTNLQLISAQAKAAWTINGRPTSSDDAQAVVQFDPSNPLNSREPEPYESGDWVRIHALGLAIAAKVPSDVATAIAQTTGALKTEIRIGLVAVGDTEPNFEPVRFSKVAKVRVEDACIHGLFFAHATGSQKYTFETTHSRWMLHT